MPEEGGKNLHGGSEVRPRDNSWRRTILKHIGGVWRKLRRVLGLAEDMSREIVGVLHRLSIAEQDMRLSVPGKRRHKRIEVQVAAAAVISRVGVGSWGKIHEWRGRS